MAGAITAVFVIGSCRNGGVGGLAFVFAFVFVVVAGGFALLLTMPLEVEDASALWLGLPKGAAILLYGLGLIPLFVVPIAYALTFDRRTLDPGDLQRVRRMREELLARALGAERTGAAGEDGDEPAVAGGGGADPQGADDAGGERQP
jgi:hypothetical protein